MKRIIITVIMMLVLSISFSIVGEACGYVYTPGSQALGIKMAGGSVTCNGETLTFDDNCVTATAYMEWCKNTLVTEAYSKVRFYLQLSDNSTSRTKYGYVRVQKSYIDGENRRNFQEITYDLKPGEDAVLCELDFTDCNNLYIMFSRKMYDGMEDDSGAVIIKLADLQFINYEPMAPTAKVISSDIYNAGEEMVTQTKIEFSQKMDTNIDPSAFSLVDENITIESAVFDESGKILTLNFSQMLEFNKEYSLQMPDTLMNDCESCEYPLADESKLLKIIFKEPTPIVVGEGGFYQNGTKIESVSSGNIDYTVRVENKYDLTEGGKEITLILIMYVDDVVKSVKYDNKILSVGQGEDFTTNVRVTNPEKTVIYALLWENPIEMNAIDDMHVLTFNN